MKAMILTAGKGTRLLPLTRKLPKPLFPVGDRPLLLYLFDLLKEYGIKEVVLNLHHLGGRIEKEIGDGRNFGIRVTYSPEEKLLGTGGGLKRASSIWGEEDILVINGDNLLELNLEKLIQFHRATQAVATMALRPRKSSDDYTPIYLDENSLLRTIGGGAPGPSFVFLGAQILSPQFIQLLPRRSPASLLDGYKAALRGARPVAGLISTGYWKEISTLELYREANLDFLRGKSPSYFYRGREEFTRRGIHAGKNNRLGPRISFYYPVYLGDNCRIGGGSVFGPSVLIGSGCTVGENCRLENVFIWPGSKVRKGSTLQNLVLTPYGRVISSSSSSK